MERKIFGLTHHPPGPPLSGPSSPAGPAIPIDSPLIRPSLPGRPYSAIISRTSSMICSILGLLK